jgi:3-hydroxyisobutyrate dehydrogenase
MGAAVAARLMEVGHEVTVWNRTPEKTKALADTGAKVASTPAQVASAVEATITMLTDAAARSTPFTMARTVSWQAM